MHSFQINVLIQFLDKKNWIKTLIWNVCILLVYITYEGWNFNSGNYLFTTDTK